MPQPNQDSYSDEILGSGRPYIAKKSLLWFCPNWNTGTGLNRSSKFSNRSSKFERVGHPGFQVDRAEISNVGFAVRILFFSF